MNAINPDMIIQHRHAPQVLTEEEIKKKDFDKSLAQMLGFCEVVPPSCFQQQSCVAAIYPRILALAGKARVVAQSLTRSGMERQEAGALSWVDLRLKARVL